MAFINDQGWIWNQWDVLPRKLDVDNVNHRGLRMFFLSNSFIKIFEEIDCYSIDFDGSKRCEFIFDKKSLS